jgi:AAA domain
VLYVPAEGLRGHKLRAPAYERKHEITGEHIRYLGTGFNLMSEEEIEEVTRLLKEASFQPHLIIIDTLARSMVGAEENSAQEMGIAIASEAAEKSERVAERDAATPCSLHARLGDSHGG